MEHYYTNNPTSKSDEREISYEIMGKELHFLTDHGVFSMDRVDHGSDILIRTVLEQEENLEGTVVDLGCGYGPVGITLSSFYPETSALMIDVNDRAMDLAYRNAQKNKVIERVRIGTAEKLSDRLSGVQAVITNPPIRAGKETIYGLFRQSFEWLADGGALYIVIRKNQGAASAEKELLRIFGNAQTVERQSGFHVIRAVREGK